MEEIWDHIARTTATLEFPAWHKAELDERWENYVRDPSQTVSWEQIQTDLRMVKGA